MSWEPSEDEEVSVSLYSALHRGLISVHSITEEGEALYDITPLGMAHARAGAMEYGYDPDDLAEAELFAFAGDLVS